MEKRYQTHLDTIGTNNGVFVNNEIFDEIQNETKVFSTDALGGIRYEDQIDMRRGAS